MKQLTPYFQLDLPVDHAVNPSAAFESIRADNALSVVSDKAREEAFLEICSWKGYEPTPLRSLGGLAAALDVSSVAYKDEASRFGLGSFKALGGAYAVMQVLKEQMANHFPDMNISLSDIRNHKFAEQVAKETVCSATDGNHGRAVAWGAQRFGCRCIIYVHERVSQGRIDAIAAYGAEVRVVKGNYDDAVREAARVSEAEGWIVVSDTSYEGYVTIPRNVLTGYTVMVTEAISQHEALFGHPPTHVFVQGGVGALAGAVASTLWDYYGVQRPICCVVEPDKAACMMKTVRQGSPAVVTGDLDTLMAGLACGEVSLIAWDILEKAADHFMAITDQSAVECMRYLANSPGNPPIVGGESAVAGLAGCILACADENLAKVLKLTSCSRILVFGTEGATDPELYAELVGRPASEVCPE